MSKCDNERTLYDRFQQFRSSLVLRIREHSLLWPQNTLKLPIRSLTDRKGRCSTFTHASNLPYYIPNVQLDSQNVAIHKSLSRSKPNSLIVSTRLRLGSHACFWFEGSSIRGKEIHFFVHNGITRASLIEVLIRLVLAGRSSHDLTSSSSIEWRFFGQTPLLDSFRKNKWRSIWKPDFSLSLP